LNRQELIEGLQTIEGQIDELIVKMKEARASKGFQRQFCCNPEGCNFFGDPETDGFCSVCFKKLRIAAANNSSSSPSGIQKDESLESKLQRVRVKIRCLVTFAHALHDVQEKSKAKEAVNPERCGYCGRKVPIAMTAVSCKCGLHFCNQHRSWVDHECSYNVKLSHKKALKSTNPNVSGKKLDRI